MTAAVAVSVGEYLATSYRPDCDYLDGEVVERNVGEIEHSRFQALLCRYIMNREDHWGVIVLTEQRVQVRPSRFRVPDITVIPAPLPDTPILSDPPFLCIEILSRSDSMFEMQDRIDDYLAFGVPNVWVVTPRTLRAFHYTSDGMTEAKDAVLRTNDPNITVPLRELEVR